MKEFTEKIDKKLDNIDQRLDNIDTKLAVYNEQLKIHIKRTEMLERDVSPIKDHVNQLKGIAKFTTFTIATVGVLAAIIQAIIK